jgi:hypothetical protein
MDLGELIPLLALVLVIGCTGIAVAGAYVLGRSRRGEQHVAPPRDEEAHARLASVGAEVRRRRRGVVRSQQPRRCHDSADARVAQQRRDTR